MILENDLMRVSVQPKGAELTSIFHKQFNLEYLWQADPTVWGKHSPVLFPIVGTLKENRYLYNGKSYTLGRHGFARDREFASVFSSQNECIFELRTDKSTFEIYPFDFIFKIRYALQDSSLSVEYNIENPGSEELYFSVGGHPAFKVPLSPGKEYVDYYLEFPAAETAPRWPITPEGLIAASPEPFFDNARKIPLTRALFQKDALVFKSLKSTSVALRSDSDSHGWEIDFSGFPYLGIWAARNANFVCIEPWCGIADAAGTTQNFTIKEGIQKLPPHETFSRTWNARFY